MKYKVIKTERHVDGKREFLFDNLAGLLKVFPVGDVSFINLEDIPTKKGAFVSFIYDHYISLTIET